MCAQPCFSLWIGPMPSPCRYDCQRRELHGFPPIPRQQGYSPPIIRISNLQQSMPRTAMATLIVATASRPHDTHPQSIARPLAARGGLHVVVPLTSILRRRRAIGCCRVSSSTLQAHRSWTHSSRGYLRSGHHAPSSPLKARSTAGTPGVGAGVAEAGQRAPLKRTRV